MKFDAGAHEHPLEKVKDMITDMTNRTQSEASLGGQPQVLLR